MEAHEDGHAGEPFEREQAPDHGHDEEEEATEPGAEHALFYHDSRRGPRSYVAAMLLFVGLACEAPEGPGGVSEGEPAPSVGELPGGDPGDSAEEVDATDAVFDVAAIHTIALTMDPAEWWDIQQNPWAESWHAADFTFTGGADGEVETLGQVGVRAFGAGSEIAGKPALKISFDKYVDGQRFHELEQLKLDNSSQDPGYLNERIGTEVLRELGVPAARTGWAEVTVNGDPAGFFVILEPIDDRFVKRWYGDADGPLYGMVSGWYSQGLNPFPAAYPDPSTWYDCQTAVKSDGQELVEAARRLAEGSDAEVAEVVDLDEFLRVSVARSVMGGIDTFSADGNNYYLYSDHGRLSQIAWDLDADLGYPYAFANAFAVNPRAPWLTSPWSVNPATGAPYTDPVLLRHLAMGADPDAVVAEVLAGPLDHAEVDAKIVASADLIRDAVWNDVLGYGPAFGPRVADLRMFLHERSSALAGHDVADCTEPDDGSVPVSAMSPTGTVGWGALTVDATNWGPGFSVNGEHTCRGLFAHAPSDVTVTVPAGVTRLTGAVGLQDWAQVCGDGAAFSVVQGGTTLWSSGVVRGYADAVPFAVDVAPGALRLVVSPNAEYSCDTAAWLDVRGR